MRKRIIITAVIIGAVVLITGAIAVAGVGDSEESVTGPAAQRAERVALALTGGGTSQGVERDDGGAGAWEVEITRPDGTSVEVLLDEGYQLVAIEDEGTDANEDADEGADQEAGG